MSKPLPTRTCLQLPETLDVIRACAVLLALPSADLPGSLAHGLRTAAARSHRRGNGGPEAGQLLVARPVAGAEVGQPGDGHGKVLAEGGHEWRGDDSGAAWRWGKATVGLIVVCYK